MSSHTSCRAVLVATALMAVGLFIVPSAHALKGDANGDGQVSAQDARLVADYLVGNVLSIPRPADADVSGDGQITTADALLILQFAKGLRTTFDFQSPLVLTVLPAAGSTNVLLTANISVFFSEPISMASLSGALTLKDVATGIAVPGRIERSQEGVIATVFPDQPLSPLTTYRIDVTTAVTDNEDNPLQQAFSATFQTQALGRGVLVSTNNLSALINELAPQPVVFKALNSGGSPVRQVPVTFTARMGSGLFEPSGKRQIIVLTDDNGLALASFRLGGEAVTHTIETSAVGFSSVTLFTVQALPLTPENLRIYSGNNQSGAPGGIAPLPLIVQATDAGGNPIGGTPITFSVTMGQGNFGGQPTATVPTDSSGTATTFFTFGASSGSVEVQATFPGMIGQAPVFSLLDLIPQPSSPTAIVGKVIDAQTQLPLQHVYVYLADNPTTWDWTDAAGFFRLTTTPGPHTVDVDGFESGVIGGFLYPVVAIPVNAVQGQENDVGMPVLLPRMDVESYIDVSGTQGGTLTLRSNPLWKMYVAPGQAHFANGTTTGRLYVAAVPADRIPMPVAGGKSSRFFDTIQPLNVAFDPPAQVSFPNADNLPPGTVTDIFTLSYSSGTFIKTGRGQVAENGVVINSLPGEGIMQGGWHNAPSPKPSPMACIKAILNLGRYAIAATMTSHGMSAGGKKVGNDLWTFLLCNLPSDQGPCSPIVNITNGPGAGGSGGGGPPVGGGGGGGGGPPVGGGGGGTGSGGGNPPDPFDKNGDDSSKNKDPDVTGISISALEPRIRILETMDLTVTVTGSSVENLTLRLKSGTPGVVKFNGQQDEVVIPAKNTVVVKLMGIGVGDTVITAKIDEAPSIPASSISLAVLAKILFKDNTRNVARKGAEAFERQGFDSKEIPEIAVNTTGVGKARISYAAFQPAESYSVFQFPVIGSIHNATYSPPQPQSADQPFTVEGVSAGVESIFVTQPGDSTMYTKLKIQVFGPKGPVEVGFHAVNGVSPAAVSTLLQGANLIWNQANITFSQAAGGLRSISIPSLGNSVDAAATSVNMSAEERAVVDKSTQTGRINVYFVNKLIDPVFQLPNTAILGDQVSNSQTGAEYIFISVGDQGDTAQTLAHELGHALGLIDIRKDPSQKASPQKHLLMYEISTVNEAVGTTVPPWQARKIRESVLIP